MKIASIQNTKSMDCRCKNEKKGKFCKDCHKAICDKCATVHQNQNHIIVGICEFAQEFLEKDCTSPRRRQTMIKMIAYNTELVREYVESNYGKMLEELEAATQIIKLRLNERITQWRTHTRQEIQTISVLATAAAIDPNPDEDYVLLQNLILQKNVKQIVNVLPKMLGEQTRIFSVLQEKIAQVKSETITFVEKILKIEHLFQNIDSLFEDSLRTQLIVLYEDLVKKSAKCKCELEEQKRKIIECNKINQELLENQKILQEEKLALKEKLQQIKNKIDTSLSAPPSEQSAPELQEKPSPPSKTETKYESKRQSNTISEPSFLHFFNSANSTLTIILVPEGKPLIQKIMGVYDDFDSTQIGSKIL